MNHFTDKDGYNGIRASSPWHFRASQPPVRLHHPFGAYFTTLPPHTKNLAKRLGIPKRKTEYIFSFDDIGDLTPLDNDRGEWIFYSPVDYDVDRKRQRLAETGKVDEL